MNEYYRLALDGDSIEKICWDRFIQHEFPSYERFWQKSVIPLSNRPKSINARTDAQLKEIGKGPHDVCLTQLHYSILKHLFKVHLILSSEKPIGIDEVTDGIIRLCSALDIAFELLERYQNPSKYSPWLEKGSKGKPGGKEAKDQWQKSSDYPLQHLRNYRNHLVHGRLTPTIIISGAQLLPKVGTENKYLDWRIIMSPKDNPGLDTDDLEPAQQILYRAWKETINYLEEQWQQVLLD